MKGNNNLSNKKVKTFQKSILKWYTSNGRKFPWREPGLSNYEILIAEMMLQKTRAENIVETYKKFLKRYPNAEKLARAKLSALEKLIKPLGLYKGRSLNFKKLGKTLVNLGLMPQEQDSLLSLPGIGPYIANAYLVSANAERLPVVDTNIRRLYERIFSIKSKPDPRRDKDIWVFSEQVLPDNNCRDFTWALLDFSAIICKKRAPSCEICPITSICDFYTSNPL